MSVVAQSPDSFFGKAFASGWVRDGLSDPGMMQVAGSEAEDWGSRRPWKHSRFQRDAVAHGSPRQWVRFSHEALRDIQYWRDLRQAIHHRPIWPDPKVLSLMVHTDASMSAHVHSAQRWSRSWQSRALRGLGFLDWRAALVHRHNYLGTPDSAAVAGEVHRTLPRAG